MIYDLNISEEQAKYFKEGLCRFCVTVDANAEKMSAFDFVRINSADKEKPGMITQFFCLEKFTDAGRLINHRLFQDKISSDEAKESISEEGNNLFLHHAEVFGVWLCGKVYCDDEPLSELILYVITQLLYRSIMFFRNLPLRKSFFKLRPEDETVERLFCEIENVKELLSILEGEKTAKNYISHALIACNQSHYDGGGTLSYHPEVLSLLDLGNAYISASDFSIDDTQTKLIMEIETQLSAIQSAYESKNYKEIREIGYEIHNVPEMIRTKNDWRQEA